MNICQVLATFPYYEQLIGEVSGGRYRVGGIGKYVYSLSTELARLGHKILIIAPKPPRYNHLSEIEMEGITIRRVAPMINVYSCSLPLGLLLRLKPKEYDIVHAHTPVPTIAELAALRIIRNGTPFIIGYHNDVVRKGSIGRLLGIAYGSTLGPFLLNRANAIITLTKSLAKSSARLANYLDRVRVVPGGVDVARFHSGLDRHRVRTKHRLGPKSNVVLFVGVLDTYKGCEYLVKAIPRIIREAPKTHLLLVGTGPLEEHLKVITKTLAVSTHVHFAGFVPDEELPYYYAASDLFVLPSISAEEGFGLVQLEAMACSKPVVTTTLPGVCEVDADEVATVHVPPKDPKALAEAIIRLLRDRALMNQLGSNGRRLVENKYTWDKVALGMQNIYSETLTNQRRSHQQ